MNLLFGHGDAVSHAAEKPQGWLIGLVLVSLTLVVILAIGLSIIQRRYIIQEQEDDEEEVEQNQEEEE